MGPPRIVPLLAALVLVAATLGSASARDGHHPIGGSVTTQVVPGGDSTVTSADAARTQGDLDIILGVTADSDRPLFGIMAVTMMQVRAPKRTAACLMISSALFKEEPEWGTRAMFRDHDIQGIAETRVLAVAAMCLRIVKLMAEIDAESTSSRARADSCGVLPIDMKVTTERTADGGYVVTPTTGARDATKRVGFKASCAGRPGRIKVHLHPKKGKNFIKAVGKRAQLGIASPSTAERGADVRVTFKSPR